ncbi:MAG TPA: T9SS type A sorting domain-containing protein, partial [Bacteroidia bacterium]|nr:T9SS type A sorting domain-containing protein [Bacteroidia bacterium]
PLSSIDFASENSLLLFPDPANGELNVNYLLPHGTTDAVLKVYDARGRICMQQQLNEDQKTIRLDISGLQEGLFFCTIESGNAVLKNGKFSIVR